MSSRRELSSDSRNSSQPSRIQPIRIRSWFSNREKWHSCRYAESGRNANLFISSNHRNASKKTRNHLRSQESGLLVGSTNLFYISHFDDYHLSRIS